MRNSTSTVRNILHVCISGYPLITRRRPRQSFPYVDLKLCRTQDKEGNEIVIDLRSDQSASVTGINYSFLRSDAK
jgi:hypothetical protein